VASAIHSAVTYHGKLMRLIAGKRHGLLMAGDDEVYDEASALHRTSFKLYAVIIIKHK